MSEFPILAMNKVKCIPKHGHYDHEKIYHILDAGFLCHLEIVVDGQRFVIPTSYGRDRDKIYIHGASTSRMLVNLEKVNAPLLSDGIPVAKRVSQLLKK